MASVVVTVGMGERPFDRLIAALDAIVDEHRVFAQVGSSAVVPRCEHQRFVDAGDLMERMLAADVVICHAGNTVRQLQRAGRVPIAVARQQRHREMNNDHQVEYLRHESEHGRVIALWALDGIAAAIADHDALAAELTRTRAVPAPVEAHVLVETLDSVCAPWALGSKRSRSWRR